MPSNIQIKGIREGLLVSIGDGEWTEIEQALLDQIQSQGEFLRGAKLILNVENHAIKAATLGKLRDQFSDQGITLWAVLTNSPMTEMNAQALGMATRIHQATGEQMHRTPVKQLDGDEAILVHRTLRSGSRIEFDGHIVVVGDVNPGAEVIAGGNVIIWGKLRGMVHAGALGDDKAIVCALSLSPTQLRIDDKIAVSPGDNQKQHPEVAMIRDGKVIAEPWISE